MEQRNQALQGRIDEMGTQILQQKAQLTEKEEQLSQQKAQLVAAIKALSATNTAAQIALIMNISQQQVEDILNTEKN